MGGRRGQGEGMGTVEGKVAGGGGRWAAAGGSGLLGEGEGCSRLAGEKSDDARQLRAVRAALVHGGDEICRTRAVYERGIPP